MIGRLVSLFEGKGEQLLTLAVKADFREEYDELKDHPVTVEIKRERGKRSRNANAYCWVLCDMIAEKIGSTKVEVYRESIRQVGVCKAFSDLSESDLRTLETAWGRLGIGWLTERIDDATLMCYYGSSEYNVKQMSRLLDNLIQDAQALGITTKTPDEIEKMKSLWGERKEK